MSASRELISLVERQAQGGARKSGRPPAYDDDIDAAFSAQGPGGRPAVREHVDFAELIRRVYRRRRLIALTALAVTGLAVLAVSLVPPRYAATAQVMIDSGPPEITGNKSTLPELAVDKETVQSEIEVIRSRRLAKVVVDKLDLTQYPDFNPALETEETTASYLTDLKAMAEPHVDTLKSLVGLDAPEEVDDERVYLKAVDLFIDSLDVAPEGQSRVVNITAESRSPKLAAGMANTLATLYLDDQVEAKADTSLRASVWLSERLEQLRPEVEKAEQAVEDYRRDAGLIEGQDSNIVEQQLSELNTQLVIAQAKRSETESRLRQIETLVDAPERIESVPQVLESPVVQDLLSQSARLNRQMAELSSELGPNHPQMASMQAEIEGLRAGLETQVRQILASLQNELEVAVGREETLISRVDEIKSNAGELKEREVGLRALQRDAKAARDLYEQILKRYRETSTDAEMNIQADVRLVSAADQPLQPSFPKKKLTVLIALAGSLSFGVLLALVLEHLDRGVRSSEEIKRLTGLRTLAMVPLIDSLETGFMGRKLSKAAVSPLDYVLNRPRSAFSESLRSLHASLSAMDYGEGIKTLLFTSAQAGEGKSTTALSLGHVLAMHGQKVIVVDADLRRPQIANRLNLLASPGLSEVMNGSCQLEDAIHRFERSGLYALTAGGQVSSPQHAPSLQTNVFDDLALRFDMVLVDAPPVLAVSDTQLLCRLVDRTIYIIRWGETPAETAIAGLKQLHESGANVAGVVLNQVDVRENAHYGYGDSAYFSKQDMAYYSN